MLERSTARAQARTRARRHALAQSLARSLSQALLVPVRKETDTQMVLLKKDQPLVVDVGTTGPMAPAPGAVSFSSSPPPRPGLRPRRSPLC